MGLALIGNGRFSTVEQKRKPNNERFVFWAVIKGYLKIITRLFGKEQWSHKIPTFKH
jgi:hypothetical protein